MIKREASFTLTFRHWLRANPLFNTTWWEAKQTRTNSISFNCVKEHQLNWLLACKHGQTNYKVPDDSQGIKPVDGIYSNHTDSIIAIKYPSFFCIIDVDAFIKERDKGTRKSLTGDTARLIADRVVYFN